MTTVPFADLGALHRPLRGELDRALAAVIDRSAFVLGSDVERFEQAWAEYVGVAHAVGVQSGTAALQAALNGLGVGPGDQVVTACNTFVATVGAIVALGAEPVLVDVDPATLLMTADTVAPGLTERTRVVVPVHLYGQVVDLAPLLELTRARGIAVVEDASQAHGARYGEAMAGSLGRLGCFSFYPGKNLGGLGEAGAVVTDDASLAAALRRYRNHGGEERYEHLEPGLNLRMASLQAAALSVKLPHLEAWNERRRRLATRYDEAFAAVAGIEPVVARSTAAGGVSATHARHLYVVRTARRDDLADFLQARGVATGIHYPVPVHRLPAYASLGLGPGSFPVAERAAVELLSLPLFPAMTDAQQQWVVEAVGAFFTGAGR